MSRDIVSYTLVDGIATIAMDDGKANALSRVMLEQLGAAFDRAQTEAQAVALIGREGRFCAGFDLREMMAGPDSARALVELGGHFLMRVYEMPLPVVIGCTGHALAAGALLVATGDSRIGAQGVFKIGLNEVATGIPVPILALELARDRLLPTELFAAVVHSKIYDPESAAQAGWLDDVVEPGSVVVEARGEAARLAKLPQRAYAISKLSVRRATAAHVRETLVSNLAELLPSA
jgi:enoyl-CoA hydratase